MYSFHLHASLWLLELWSGPSVSAWPLEHHHAWTSPNLLPRSTPIPNATRHHNTRCSCIIHLNPSSRSVIFLQLSFPTLRHGSSSYFAEQLRLCMSTCTFSWTALPPVYPFLLLLLFARRETLLAPRALLERPLLACAVGEASVSPSNLHTSRTSVHEVFSVVRYLNLPLQIAEERIMNLVVQTSVC